MTGLYCAKVEITSLLSGKSGVDIDKQLRAERRAKIQEMYLACYTQEEIAEDVDLPKQRVTELCPEMEGFPNPDKLLATFQDDFDTPVYNVWSIPLQAADEVVSGCTLSLAGHYIIISFFVVLVRPMFNQWFRIPTFAAARSRDLPSSLGGKFSTMFKSFLTPCRSLAEAVNFPVRYSA